MIDPKLFTVERLLAAMLDDRHGNIDVWRKRAEIVPAYVSPHAPEGTRPRCVVRFDTSFLCYSKGPAQGYHWDMLTPELALLALLRAPVPPWLVKPSGRRRS